MTIGIGRLKKLNEVTAQIVPLEEVTYKQFKEFLDSFDEERKTWSLDLQHHFKNDKEFYEGMLYAIACIHGKKMIGLCSCYSNCDLRELVEVSFVVKKEYQSQGIGTTFLKRVEWDQKKHYGTKYIYAKHYKDNIASHKAFLKVGYEEWTLDKIPRGDGSYFYRKEMVDDDTFDWKIKEIG